MLPPRSGTFSSRPDDDMSPDPYSLDMHAEIWRYHPPSDRWKLVRYELRLEADGIPSATVTLSRGDEKQTDTFFGGDGPLDALFRVIEKITGIQVVVRDYRVQWTAAAGDQDAGLAGWAEGGFHATLAHLVIGRLGVLELARQAQIARMSSSVASVRGSFWVITHWLRPSHRNPRESRGPADVSVTSPSSFPLA